MNVEVIPSMVTAAPGEEVTCRLRIESTESATVSYTLRVVGFDASDVRASPPRGQLPAGGIAEVDLRFSIPDAFAAGRHAVAVEVVPDGNGTHPAVAPLTVEVGTIEPVAVAVVPSTLRGRRRARFRVDVDNRASAPMEVELTGEAPDVDIRLTPDRLQLRPGARVQVKGRAKGPRHLVGRPLQHALSVVARSRSAPRYAPATFHQRPLLPNSLRTASVILLVVAVWAAALGGAYYWWSQLNDDEPEQVQEAELVDTDGDGTPDTPGDELLDTDGDGAPDTPAAEVAEQAVAGGGGSDDADGETAPTSAVVGGTVTAGETGENSDVGVTLTPLDLGESPEAGGAAQLGGTTQSGFSSFRGPAGQSAPGAQFVAVGAATSPGEGSPVKLWPERFGRYESADRPSVRQTVSVQSTATRNEGAWLFSDVPIGQRYEVHFAKPGFNSQSFVVSPPPDGEPIELDVELEPANGALNGVVTGPGGEGLGNVDIEVTDGTLTFTTSTGTDEDDPGAWSLSGISTPGTYTLTATLDGYGTEVAQVALEPGEQRDDIDVDMVPGVGSISGRISSGGEPLGGVSITASDDEETHTTTSLTEGDTGAFSLPQLDIPAEYTLTVEAEGYITETRLVDLEGNTTGVDVAMSTTTATITGLVTSGRDGPLPGANIEVNGEDLEFHTDSAAAPDAGAFSMSEVPPGTYRIEFSRFDHRPVSQLVTVEAGEVADLGEIELPFGREPSVEEDGSLTVRVVDSTGTDLTGATVRVRDASTQEVVATLPDPDQPGSGDDQATFVFEPLDVGTYIVEAERPPRYRPVTRRVSVGLGEESVTIPLYQLGQASGRLVDSLTGDELDDYEVTIMRVNPDGTETEVQRIVVPDGATADDGPDSNQIRWETEANSLTTGIYRVDVTDPPPGYLVRPDQELFADPDDEFEPMEFELAPDREDPLELNDIEADIFPSLTGDVRVPLFDPNSDDVTFEPVDSDEFSVQLVCGGGDPVPATELLSREGRVEPDAYRFDPLTLQENDLRGDCELEVTTNEDDFQTATVPLPSELQPTDGESLSDQVVNVALVPTLQDCSDPELFPDTESPPQICGSVYWVDQYDDTQVPAPNVNVESQGDVIVGFEPGAADGEQPEPSLAGSPLQTSTNEHGGWMFVDPRQVFGETGYAFEHRGYEPRTIRLTVDEHGRDAAPGEPSPGPPLDADDEERGIRAELDARGGAITGDIAVLTIRDPAALGEFEMSVSGADDHSTTFELDGPAPKVQTDDPGTYFATITGPEDVELDSEVSDVDVSHTPGQDVGFSHTYVELGQIDVQVNDAVGTPVSGVDVTVRHDKLPPFPPEDPFVRGDPDDLSDGGATDDSGHVSFARLPVNQLAPVIFPTMYTLQIDGAAGYDIEAARVTAVTDHRGDTRSCGPDLPACDLAVFAGSELTVTIEIERYGSITGNVVGDLDPASDDGGNRVALPVQENRLSVTATRVRDKDGTVLPQPWESFEADAIDDDGFTVSGPPGYYRTDAAHPFYRQLDVSNIPCPHPGLFDPTYPDPACAPGTVTVPGSDEPLFRMSNIAPGSTEPNHISNPWVLDTLPSRIGLDVNVHETDQNQTAIDGATVEIYDPDEPNSDPVFMGVTGGDGSLEHDILPGDYRVVITKMDGNGNDLYFPVIVTVNLPQGSDEDERTRTITAALPRIGGTFTGAIVAQNHEGDPVAVPDGIEITAKFDPPAVQVSGSGTSATVPNEHSPPDPSVTCSTDSEAPPNGSGCQHSAGSNDARPRYGYRFTGLPGGIHVFEFPVAAGYSTPSSESLTESVPATGITEAQSDVAYTAENRKVQMNVTATPSIDADQIDVTLTDPDPRDGMRTLEPVSDGPGDGQYTFAVDGVTPDPEPYQLQVTADRYESIDTQVLIPPGVDLHQLPAQTIDANAAVITGIARTQSKPQSQSRLCPSAEDDNPQLPRLTLLGSEGQVLETDPDTWCPDEENGRFEFVVAETGTYGLRLEADEFVTREIGNIDVDALGAVVNQNITVKALGRFAITVGGNPEPPDGGTIDVTMVQPESPDAPTGTRDQRQFTFDVDPDHDYQFEVSAPGYVTQRVPGDGTIGIDPGELIKRNATLVQSATVKLRVTGPDPGDITVEPIQGSSSVIDTSQNGRVFRFEVKPGTKYQFRMTAPGYAAQTVSVTPGPGRDINRDVDLERRTIAGTVSTSTTDDENLSGIEVRATHASDDVEPVTTKTKNRAGEFTLTGVIAGSWTVTAEKLGTGSGQAVVEISATDGHLTDVPLEFTTRPVALTFEVDPGDAAIALTYGADEKKSGAAGETLTVPENLFPVAWTASLEGYQSASDSAELADVDVGDDGETLTVTVTGIELVENEND